MSGQALPGMIFSLQSETQETSALGLLQNAEHLLSTPWLLSKAEMNWWIIESLQDVWVAHHSWFWDQVPLSSQVPRKGHTWPGFVTCSLWSLCRITTAPGSLVVKNLSASAGDAGLIPGSGRSAGGGNGNPLQYSFLESSMDREAWWATVHRVAKNQTQLSD